MSTTDELELEIAEMWKQTLGLSEVSHHAYFLGLGGTPELGEKLVARLEARYGGVWHMIMLICAPTIAEQALYVRRYYLDRSEDAKAPPPDVAAWRESYAEMGEPDPKPERKNPPATFILTPGRSGSTLLRVMLAGHPGLYAPPEMDLLAYTTTEQRQQACLSGWCDPGGLILALRDLWGDEAPTRIAAWEAANLPIQEVYRQIQERAGGRMLVEKCISYALSLSFLRRAEDWFEGTRFVHLVRHPLPTIRSFRAFHLDHLLELRDTPSTLDYRHRPEMTWLLVHENILRFLEEIPPERQTRLLFEDLVTQPEARMRELAQFLGVPFEQAMLRPYDGARMTANIPGRTAGDRSFYTYDSINPALADKSRRLPSDGPLTPETVALAQRFGYTDL